MFEAPEGEWSAASASEFALGYRLRNYKFDKYKTKKGEADDSAPKAHDVTILVADVEAAKAEHAHREPVAEGVELARTLVNEPPNVIFPESFADKALELSKIGVEVTVLDEKAMAKLGMGALLAVGHGSERESRFVVMRWKGSKAKKSAPVAIVGKGVCFDSWRHLDQARCLDGGHEGRHGGRGLSSSGSCTRWPRRKAKANVVGVIGLVEEYAERKFLPPRRHSHLDVRPDHRSRQHRRGRPPGARRRAVVGPRRTSSRG